MQWQWSSNLKITLMDLMPSFSSMWWIGSSSASTTARFSSNMRKFILSHFDENQSGWLSGQVGLGASTNFHPEYNTL